MTATLAPLDPRLAYRPKQAAEQLGVSVREMYELLSAGRIRSVKLGSARLIRHEALVEFLDGLEQAS